MAMQPPSQALHGSGNLLADRRYNYAEAALADGDAEAARDLFAQTLELVPHWLPARLGLGKACRRLNRLDEAISAFRAVAHDDPTDRLGARAHLAQLGARGGALTSGYVAALFDDYAPRFDAHLTAGLDYRAPEVLVAAINEVSGKRVFHRVLDLGCGTGLMARALGAQASEIVGVDLSGRMLDVAHETGLYRRLDIGDCSEWLAAGAPESADLVIAADVFCYIENLEPVFAQAHRVLETSGLFAFTIQTHTDPGMRIGDDLRVHHHPDLIRDIAHKTSFVAHLERITSVRKDRGIPVPGALFVLER